MLLAVALAVAATSASADPPAPADEGKANDALALEFFERAETAYQRGRFLEAVDLLKRSYALRREPVIFYNLARAYEGLGDLDRAARAYEDFVKAEPDTPDRASIEARVANLRRTNAEREAAKASRPPPRKLSVVPWVVAGAGALGIGAGAVLEVLALGRHASANEEPAQLTAEADQRDAQRLATASGVAFVAAGVILAVGVVWGIVDVRLNASSRAAFVPAPGGVALRLPIP
jgi:tetratricopeptide (TPR) repeat protein